MTFDVGSVFQRIPCSHKKRGDKVIIPLLSLHHISEGVDAQNSQAVYSCSLYLMIGKFILFSSSSHISYSYV